MLGGVARAFVSIVRRWLGGAVTRARAAVVIAGACCVASPASAAPPLLTPQGQLNPEWHFVGLPQGKKPATKFSAERLEGHAGVRIEAHDSYGNWVHQFATPTRVLTLRWAWRVDQTNAHTDLAHKAGDDVAARVCVSFDMPLERLSFMERSKLLLARSISGVELSAATLCYVWGGHEAKGSFIDSVYTRRVRQIVLRNASDALATWFDESRDVMADFLKSFADEAQQPLPVTALIVGADADNTHAHTVSHVADLQAKP